MSKTIIVCLDIPEDLLDKIERHIKEGSSKNEKLVKLIEVGYHALVSKDKW